MSGDGGGRWTYSQGHCRNLGQSQKQKKMVLSACWCNVLCTLVWAVSAASLKELVSKTVLVQS